jgi:hypothetical protein
MSTPIRNLLILVLALAGSTAYATTIVAPNAYTSAVGNDALNTVINTSTRTYEMQIAASELAGIAVGSSLNGLSWRLYFGATTNASGLRSWSDYEITLAQATNTVAGMSANFAANMLNPVLVHDGAFSYNLSGFSATGTPKPFAPLINFSTAYTYMGGDLVVLISHTTATGGTLDFLDALSSTRANYGSKFKAISDTTFHSTTASTTNQLFVITQFDYSAPAAVPEPSSVALFGIGMLGLLARRRKVAYVVSGLLIGRIIPTLRPHRYTQMSR